jgi:hypothetical protein
LAATVLGVGLLAVSCSGGKVGEEVLFHSPVSNADQVLTKSGVAFDTESRDGNGAVVIDSKSPTTVRLFELSGLSFETKQLIYRANLRTEDVEGQVYLEMWCSLPGRGEFFSRSLHAPLTGTTGWTTQETPFFFEKGQVPSMVKLNVVVEGPGRVWVDDVVLARAIG